MLDQLQQDSAFLVKHDIMDYSLLLGIEKVSICFAFIYVPACFLSFRLT